jgi:hypothetical protein
MRFQLYFFLKAIRIPKEDQNFINKFGDEHPEYINTIGRYFPKM